MEKSKPNINENVDFYMFLKTCYVMIVNFGKYHAQHRQSVLYPVII